MHQFIVFNREEIINRLDGFAPGMGLAITPIKYEALTPDIFCFLFRTTNRDQKDFYFVLLSFDHMANFQRADDTILHWSGTKNTEYLEPREGMATYDTKDEHLKKLTCNYKDIYHSMLAVVDRPAGDGYWATNIVIRPGEDIDEKLEHLSKDDLKRAKQAMAGILSHQSSADPKKGFAESFLANSGQPRSTESLKINDTNLAISLFKNNFNEWEFFTTIVRDEDPNKKLGL